MPARAPTTVANKETWRDWMPEGAPEPGLLTLNELLEDLRVERGIELSPSTLEYYRKIGVLPRPIRQRHEGATQAVYPEWFIGAIEHLKRLQERGRSLEEIKPYMRHWALSEIRWRDPMEPANVVIDRALKTYAQEVMEKTDTPSINTIRVVFLDNEGREIWNHETGLG